MSSPSRHQWRATVAGLVVGVVVLVFATAILTSAVSSSNTSSTVGSLARQLEDANKQLDQLRSDYATAQAESTAARDNLTRQNRRLQHKLDVLVRFLRANGLSVPKVANDSPPPTAAPAEVGPPAPKAPTSRPPKSSPGTPGHTATPAPTATPGPTGAGDLTCRLAPLLCP